jgi:hypothetical protein
LGKQVLEGREFGSIRSHALTIRRRSAKSNGLEFSTNAHFRHYRFPELAEHNYHRRTRRGSVLALHFPEHAVTTPSTFAPALTFWPGSVILTEPTDSATNNGGEPRLYTDMAGPSTSLNLGGLINSYGANAPTVFAQQCSSLNTWSSIWISCPAGDSISNGFAPIGAFCCKPAWWLAHLYVLSKGGGESPSLPTLTPRNRDHFRSLPIHNSTYNKALTKCPTWNTSQIFQKTPALLDVDGQHLRARDYVIQRSRGGFVYRGFA